MTAVAASKFFLHIRDGDRLIEDQEGVEAVSIDAVREHAVVAAREFLAEGLIEPGQTDAQGFEIVDEHGQAQAYMPFHELLG